MDIYIRILFNFLLYQIYQSIMFVPSNVVLAIENSESAASEVVAYFPYTENTKAKSNRQKLNLTFAVLLPTEIKDPDSMDCIQKKTLPVMELGVRKIQESGFLNVDLNVMIIFRDTFYSSNYGPVAFFEICAKRTVHAVFGLVNDYVVAPTARYAAVYQIPVLTSSGLVKAIDDKKSYYGTTTRMMGSITNMGRAVKEIMDLFNWTTTAVICQNREAHGNSNCYHHLNGVQEAVKSDYAKQFNEHTIDRENATVFLRTIMVKTRIIILCTDPISMRHIMLAAEELGMIDSGEYVFLSIDLFSSIRKKWIQPWYDEQDIIENNERARKAYAALLIVTAHQPNDESYMLFSEKVKQLSAEKYNYTFAKDESVSTFVTTFYDAVLLYAYALNDSLLNDPQTLRQPLNGTEVVRLMWNRSFHGITGNVTIDKNGDRVSAFSMLDMNPQSGNFEIVAHYFANHLQYIKGKSIHWAGGRTSPPPNMPECGFDGSLCPDNSIPGYAILSLFLGFTVILMAITSFLGYRRYKSELEINSMAWKIYWHEVMPCDIQIAKLRGSMHSLVKRGSQITLNSEDIGSLAGDRQIFIPVGFYKGCKVAIKKIDETNINMNRSLMLELKKMKDLQHDHLVKFYGACMDPLKCCILTEYCPKGSLQDILENEQISLDWMFKLSLMHDIVRGMHFLHQSDIKSHGNLKSSNCVVDSKFVLKITDFGLHQLRKRNSEDDIENSGSHAYWKKYLWTAPELLRMLNSPLEGTQKGDVYSFGIIVHEMTTRQGPFFLGSDCHKSPQEIIELVKGFPNEKRHPYQAKGEPYRPRIEDTTYDDINNIMTRCWAEDPCERPDFQYLKATIRKINKDNETGNIVDNLLKRMEQYTNNLEGLVEERTRDYLEEKKKCEKLLYQLLPVTVAAQLIAGQPVVAEVYDQVTIYFSDIVGFTAISAESTPMQVVSFLNDLYSCFDSIVGNFDVYKVETIGDAYMVVSGLPLRNGNQHAREIARLALALLNAVKKFTIRHRPTDQLKLRIGLNSGPVVAGVVGHKMPRYCLFGDVVNTASRMESTGQALKIHISQTTKEYLEQFGTFVITKRGFVEMKGKGEMLTYWLEGERIPMSHSDNSVTTSGHCMLMPADDEHGSLNSKHIMNSLISSDIGDHQQQLQFADETELAVINGDTHQHRYKMPNLPLTTNSSDNMNCKNISNNTQHLMGYNNNYQHNDSATEEIHKNTCSLVEKCSVGNMNRANFDTIVKTNNKRNLSNSNSNKLNDLSGCSSGNIKSATQPLLNRTNV